MMLCMSRADEMHYQMALFCVNDVMAADVASEIRLRQSMRSLLT